MSFNNFPDIGEIIKVGGFLHANPTSTGSEAGWGTKVGYAAKGLSIQPNIERMPLTTMETGIIPTMVIYTGCTYNIEIGIKNYNEESLALCFPQFASTTGVTLPGSLKTGHDFFDDAVTLLYVPDDVLNHPAVLISNAVALFNFGAALHFHHTSEAIFQASFLGGSVQIDKLSEIII